MALPAAIALSGLNEEYFSDGLNDVFNRGAVLLKSPSVSSLASSEDRYSQESGISSMSDDTAVIRSLAPFFELIFKTQIELKENDMDCKESVTKRAIQQEIIHEKRNILDLAENIRWKWDFQAAVMRSGPSYFFENRSQYSRVLGAHLPAHITFTCSAEGCLYKEHRYE